MSRRLVSLSIAVALFAAACGGAATTAAGDPASEAPGEPVPTTPFVMFDGTPATLADYGGRPLVANFWASWCPSCIAEMSAAFKPVQELLGDQVAFLGLNLQDERDRALELIDETGVLFDLGEDADGELYVELGGIGMPFTVFIDADGNIIEEHNGPLTEQQLIDLIEETILP